ncbi:LysE family translocator [Halarcobacter sp.]|uniref:LysE family translocator n=1 Tax=Halarcobacter sp. TaxID=2321133 RepID=UPI0029F55BFB|nr:LysE family translocator [Halarcobacter sp.]
MIEDLNFWFLFLSAAVLISISPGPDLIYILTRTVNNGKKVGLISSLGVCTGALVHVVAAAVGISAILVTSAYAFTIVKIVGAFYLFFLAYQAFKQKNRNLNVTKKSFTNISMFKAFKEGVLIDILNPKVAIFFMAFLPQFVREGHGSIPIQLLYLGFLVILVGMVVEFSIVILTSKVSKRIQVNKSVSAWLNKIVGTIFLALGLKLIFSTNK